MSHFRELDYSNRGIRTRNLSETVQIGVQMRNLPSPQSKNSIFSIFEAKNTKNKNLPAPNALNADAALLNNDVGLLRNGEDGAVIKTSPPPPEFSRSIGTGAWTGGTSCDPNTLLTAACNRKTSKNCQNSNLETKIRVTMTHQ